MKKYFLFLFNTVTRHILFNNQPFSVSGTSSNSCLTFVVFDNDIIEPTYNYSLHLQNGTDSVKFQGLSSVTIILQDNDGKENICKYNFCDYHNNLLFLSKEMYINYDVAVVDFVARS